MLPEKFTERMKEMLGEEYARFLKSYEQKEIHALRVNPLKCRPEEFFKKEPFTLSPVIWNENGFYYENEERPGRHPYHEAGVYYIQEASAMAPAVYLDAKPGERVLDLCAAPGGKSTQIGAAMQQQGILICNEIHPARAKILSENVERMGIRNAIVTNETPQRLMAAFPEYFDRILVDAPCSGEGMFRKHEEVMTEWSPENVVLCARRQDEILDCAANMLVPGGRLVYSTCTFAPQENEGTIARFLMSHPDFEIELVEKYPGMVPGVPEWAQKYGGSENPVHGFGETKTAGFCSLKGGGQQEGVERTIRLWPHKLNGEGHYVAVLKKKGEPAAERRISLQKSLKEKECKEYLEFFKENIKINLSGILVKFGDQLYLAPENTPFLNKLKILRPGLHLGTIKKDRLEPSHALALTLSAEDVTHSWNLAADSGEIADYLRGQTFYAEGAKGWYLITVDGYSIGWGKLSGNVMKNHYPRGLRKL